MQNACKNLTKLKRSPRGQSFFFGSPVSFLKILWNSQTSCRSLNSSSLENQRKLQAFQIFSYIITSSGCYPSLITRMSRRHTDTAKIFILSFLSFCIISCQAYSSCQMETFQTHKENRIPRILSESYCLASGEFCGPSHEVEIAKNPLTQLHFLILILVWTNDEYAGSGICERRPDRTQEEHDYCIRMCLY